MKVTNRCWLAVGLMLLASTAHADRLRNIKVGELVPPFSMRTLDGDTLASDDLVGNVVILVYLSAEQKSSESVTISAHRISQTLNRKDLSLVYATADVSRAGYFRERRDGSNIHEPLGLDIERTLYGGLGLFVLPTTIVMDREGRLAHVISAYKSDYDHVLQSYVLHTLGDIDDAELEKRLQTQSFQRGRPADKLARHRAASALLRENGLVHDAENELKSALEIDPDHADTRLDLASLYVANDRVDEADVIVAAVLEAEPNNRRAKLMQGIVLYHQEQFDEAEVVLTRVLLLNPDPVFTHYYLGLIQEEKGDTRKAAEHYREALQRALRNRPM